MEPFKNALNEAVIREAAPHLHASWGGFDSERFVALATDGLEALELKARVAHIAGALGRCLPEDWAAACDVLVGALADVDDSDPAVAGETTGGGVSGWMVWPMTSLVGAEGLDAPEVSLPALHALTQRWSAEFAIRHFLLRHPQSTLETLRAWTRDRSAHVRRLVSEGTRPRLPWGIRLAPFVTDPTPTLELLELLKDDPSEYVRRSVANHLGDIAKDHADLAVDTATRWLEGAGEHRKKLASHGLRWLVKKGHAGALAALGFGPAEVRATLSGSPPEVAVGEAVTFELALESTADRAQSLLVDYLVHHVKANGETSPKVFKWTRRELGPRATLTLKKTHPMRVVSTRNYHAGTHRIEVQVNGAIVAGWDFELETPSP